MAKERLDVLLVKRNLAESREKAKAYHFLRNLKSRKDFLKTKFSAEATVKNGRSKKFFAGLYGMTGSMQKEAVSTFPIAGSNINRNILMDMNSHSSMSTITAS